MRRACCSDKGAGAGPRAGPWAAARELDDSAVPNVSARSMRLRYVAPPPKSCTDAAHPCKSGSLVSDRFLRTTAFNLLFTRPIGPGRIRAEGRWISGKRRVYVAEASLIDSDGEEVGRGTGTFMRSQFPLSSLPGYAA